MIVETRILGLSRAEIIWRVIFLTCIILVVGFDLFVWRPN